MTQNGCPGNRDLLVIVVLWLAVSVAYCCEITEILDRILAADTTRMPRQLHIESGISMLESPSDRSVSAFLHKIDLLYDGRRIDRRYSRFDLKGGDRTLAKEGGISGQMNGVYGARVLARLLWHS